MDSWHYLLVLSACLIVTAPLEWFGAGAYRQPARVVRAIVPVAAIFLAWDVLAVSAGVWSFNPRYVTGVELPGHIPIEEVLFFVVIPLCGLLTYSAVGFLLDRIPRGRRRTEREPR
ncbi:lycopene cyclase domain-containing protein [Rhodococcus chondri]|uniref:Lycopene cyclase domain-containing protein n=1 Tax=Rhodococcus chondri TaxID=3065941 RepID=A0ABU7JYI0_9NOCA|nr:lycopene cyclase domain-containing protein [Rhodococcus sp. CC-R104]MEE2035066.1 lycopene cyclase domain-containing protein [Rhodococcus sp. CC-R104]